MEALRIDRRTAVEQVADGLRERMFDGALPPGTRLRELELADTLQVARSTVREALLVLRKERLVVRRDPGRGWEVRRLRADEVADNFRARRWLGFAAVHAVQETSGETLAVIERAVDVLQEAVHAADTARIVAADIDYHLALVRLTGSERLVGMYAELLRDLRPLVAVVEQPSDWQAEVDSYREVLRLMRTQGSGDAHRVLADSLNRVERTMLTAVAAQPVP